MTKQLLQGWIAPANMMRTACAAAAVSILCVTSALAQGQVRPPAPLMEQIAEQNLCIARADKTIRQQNEVAKEVGVIDKAALYQAGVEKVHCKHNLDYLQACKRSGKCAGLPPDPYAPTRVEYQAPTASMP